MMNITYQDRVIGVELRGDTWYVSSPSRGLRRWLEELGVCDSEGRIVNPEAYGLE